MTPEASPPAIRAKPFVLNLLAGFVLVSGSVLFANATDLQYHARLDLGGDEAQGTAEALGGGQYRLRYERGDVIRTRRYEGGFGFQGGPDGPGETVGVTFAVDPAEPGYFQPKSVSYMPALFALALFLLGAVFLGRARRYIPRRRIPRSGKPED